MSMIRQQWLTLVRKQAHIQHHWDQMGQKRLLKFIVKLIPRLLDVESCSIFVHDESNEKVWLVCATDLSEREIEVPKEGSLVGEVISTGKYQIRTGMENQPGIHKLVDQYTNSITRDILCVPIPGLTTEKVTGAIQVRNKQGGRLYTEEDRLVLEEMTYYMQLLVENIFLGQEIADLSEKISKKLGFAELIVKSWAVLMVLLILSVIVYVTPIMLTGF